MLKNATKKDFKEKVLENEKTTLVDFWAPWCGPCKMIGPVLEEIASESDEFDIVKVNVDENQDLAMEYGVQSIPTMYLFKNGEVVKETIGFMPKAKVIEFIKSV